MRKPETIRAIISGLEVQIDSKFIHIRPFAIP